MTPALVVVSEVGTGMGKRPSDKHFASWLGLCLGTKMTGGKLMSGKTKRCAHRAAQTLTLPLFRVALNPRFTRPFYAVPRTSAARTASG